MTRASLAYWNSGEVKDRIRSLVLATTTEGSPDFVAPVDRVVVFDNDGTLWTEQPMYTQLRHILDNFVAMAPDHPEWAAQPVLKAVMEGDLAALAGYGEEGIVAIGMAVLVGKTSALLRPDLPATVPVPQLSARPRLTPSSSSPAAASSSCTPSPKRPTASHPSKSSAAAPSPNTRRATGIAKLFFGDRQVGQVEMPVTVPLQFGLAAAITVGLDSNSPVTPEYKPPFKFTGTVKRVRVDVTGEPFEDQAAKFRALMARQ